MTHTVFGLNMGNPMTYSPIPNICISNFGRSDPPARVDGTAGLTGKRDCQESALFCLFLLCALVLGRIMLPVVG
jgi:hypothetical protein